MSQYNNEELFEMLMPYSLYNCNANETAWEYQGIFRNSQNTSRRFVSQLVEQMHEKVYPVCGLSSPTLRLTNAKIDILANICSHLHISIWTAASEINIPHTIL